MTCHSCSMLANSALYQEMFATLAKGTFSNTAKQHVTMPKRHITLKTALCVVDRILITVIPLRPTSLHESFSERSTSSLRLESAIRYSSIKQPDKTPCPKCNRWRLLLHCGQAFDCVVVRYRNIDAGRPSSLALCSGFRWSVNTPNGLLGTNAALVECSMLEAHHVTQPST